MRSRIQAAHECVEMEADRALMASAASPAERRFSPHALARQFAHFIIVQEQAIPD